MASPGRSAAVRIDMPDPGSARSFWLQEALAHDPGETCPPLRSRVSADVCIAGGGFAGLWTAIELIEREPDLCVALLESDICGGGASGRNGGFVSSSWWDLEGLMGLFARESGFRYAQLVADEVHDIGRWVDANGVDCWFHAEGILVAEAGGWQRGAHDSDVEAAVSLGVPEAIVNVSAEEARSYADSPRFVGGTFVEDCAIVQPARLARGLRRVCLERGVHVFEGTAAGRIEGGFPAVVHAGEGAVKADQVVLTTGSWAASRSGFRRAFSNVVDYMVVTEPLGDRLADIGWTSMVGIGDSREMLFYLRPTEDGRIAIGGGAMAVLFGGHVGRSSTHDRRVAEEAARGLLWLFPQLEGVRFTHAWGGPIDHTVSFTPFFQTLEPGNVYAGLGFAGHGLTQTKLGARILTSLVLGTDDEWASLPVVGPPLAKVPPEPGRYPAVRAIERAMESGDRLEEAGRPRGALRSLIGNTPSRLRERLMRGR